MSDESVEPKPPSRSGSRVVRPASAHASAVGRRWRRMPAPRLSMALEVSMAAGQRNAACAALGRKCTVRDSIASVSRVSGTHGTRLERRKL